MLALQGEPLTLVIGKDEGLRDHVAQMLQQMGHRSESAETAREALLSMESPKPLESILLIDFTYDMSLTQLVQRIRSLTAVATMFRLAFSSKRPKSSKRSWGKEAWFVPLFPEMSQGCSISSNT